jgi:pyrroline-5-carboxylate reductase
LAGSIIIGAATLLCKQGAQPTENIGQISLPGGATILLCKGCVAQHYYKKAATY